MLPIARTVIKKLFFVAPTDGFVAVAVKNLLSMLEFPLHCPGAFLFCLPIFESSRAFSVKLIS